MADARALNGNLASLMGLLRPGTPGGLSGLSFLLIGLVIISSIAVPGFASGATLQSIMFQMPELGLLSLAMVVPLISGGLNLAIIATANQAALLMAWLMKIMLASGMPVALIIVAAMLAGLLICILWGLITGAIVAYTGVHPILVTLGTKSLIDGISIYLTRGTIISGLPPQYSAVGNDVVFGIPVPFVVLIVASVLVGLLLRRTGFGVATFMVGSNIEATRYSAIDTRRVLVGVYLASSVLCFVAASLMLARFNSASADYAQSYLLITILAAVLGGVDPFGGFGKVAGLILALAILQVLASGSNLLGFSDYLKLAVWGFVLIGVMTAQKLFARVCTADKETPMATRIGMHFSLWAASWTRETAELAVSECAKYGLEIIEIPLLAPETIDVAHARDLLAAHKVAPSGSLCLPDDKLATKDPAAARDFVLRALETAHALGCTFLGGVTYSALGYKSGKSPTEAEYDNIVTALQPVARRAAELGMQLGLEPCNRYETHLLNTAEQSLKLLDRIGAPNTTVHLDTYHMNIEEKGVGHGFRVAGARAPYIHISESDRGVPGTGTIDWDDAFAALAAIRFSGDLVIESFVTLPPEIAAALCVWRPVAKDRYEVLDQGVTTIRALAKTHGLIG